MQLLNLAMKQNAGNTGTALWSSVFRWSDAGTASLGTAGTWNYYGWRYNLVDVKWDFLGASKNII